MSTKRTLQVWEGTTDLINLRKNGFNFVVAKSVIGNDGKLSYNIVWQSKALAPRINISWETKYALNWTVDVPDANVSIVAGGIWQECEPGQAFDITADGLWSPSESNPGIPGYLTVGRNGYASPGSLGVHVVVGCWDGSDYQPIWIDKIPLGLNMTSKYQPQERLQWWYQAGVQSAVMISETNSPKNEGNFSAPNSSTGKFYLSTTYTYAAGKWMDSPSPPPSMLFSGVLPLGDGTSRSANTNLNGTNTNGDKSSDFNSGEIIKPSATPQFIFWPALRRILFRPIIKPEQVPRLREFITNKLKIKYKNVSVTYSRTTEKFEATYGPPNDPKSQDLHVGVMSNLAEDDLAEILKMAKNEGLLDGVSAEITLD